MEEEKSEGDLLYVGPAFVPVMRFKGKMYVEIRDFECCVGDIQRELENLSELNRKQSKAFGETMKDYRGLLRDYMKIGEENKKLKEENEYRKSIVDIIPEGEGNVAEETIKDLQDRIKELKEDVDYFRQCYLDLKKLCEKEGFMLSCEEVTKMFNLDKKK